MAYLTFFGIVLLASVASFLLGWLWYSKKLFGGIWMAEMGISMQPEGMDKKKMTKTMVTGLITEFVKAFFLVYIAISFNANQFILGILIWVGFIATTFMNSVNYEGRSWKMFFINSGYQLASIILMGIVFYLV